MVKISVKVLQVATNGLVDLLSISRPTNYVTSAIAKQSPERKGVYKASIDLRWVSLSSGYRVT